MSLSHPYKTVLDGLSPFTKYDTFLFTSHFVNGMGSVGRETTGFELPSATLAYLNLSENSKVRHVLEFFAGYPKLIVVEKSRMGNPYYIIRHLSEELSPENLRNRVLCGMLFWAGMRRNEAVMLRKKDIDFISKTINVPTLKQRKGVVYRPVPLDHVPTAELKLWNEYMDEFRPDDMLFDITGRTVERVTHSCLGMHPHSLRHGLGLFLYELTKDIRLVSQVLRHTNITNTMIYMRLSMDGIREKLKYS